MRAIAQQEARDRQSCVIATADEVVDASFSCDEATDLYLLVTDDWRSRERPGMRKDTVADLVKRARSIFPGKLHVVCRADAVPDGIPARPAAIRSVFDVSYSQADRTPTNRSEQALLETLEGSEALRRLSLEVVRSVKFDRIVNDEGRSLIDQCEKDLKGVWKDPSANEFDLLVVRGGTQEVVAAIEVDGSVHRYVYRTPEEEAERSGERWRRFDLPKTLAETRRDFAALVERVSYDRRKDWYVGKILGATCALLTPVQQGTLERRLDSELEMAHKGAPWLGADIRWICDPTDIPESSPFLYLRVPTDGTTCLEVDELIPKGFDGDRPHTIEEYVSRQAERGAGGFFLREKQ